MKNRVFIFIVMFISDLNPGFSQIITPLSLDEHPRNSFDPFRKGTYDWENYQIPDDAADFALQVLTR